jgi:hypothetical protein
VCEFAVKIRMKRGKGIYIYRERDGVEGGVR